MFEQVLKTEIDNLTIEMLRNSKKKNNAKSKNYITIYYYHRPEEETLKSLYAYKTFNQAWKLFFDKVRAIKGGTKIEITNKFTR